MVETAVVPEFVAIDFETANHSPASACSVGLARFDSSGTLLETFSALLKPHPDHDAFFLGNVGVHGITKKDVAGAPEWDAVYETIREFIGDTPLLAHSMRFDNSVLVALNDVYDLAQLDCSLMCSLQFARKHFAGSIGGHGLANVFAHYFPEEEFAHHQAEADAIAAGRIFVEMARNYSVDKVSAQALYKPQTGSRKRISKVRFIPA